MLSQRTPIFAVALFLAAGAFGAIAGTAILLIGLDRESQTQAFVQTPQFVVWLVLICCLFAFLPIAGLQGTRLICRTWPSTKLSFSFYCSLGLLIVFFLVPMCASNYFPSVAPSFPDGSFKTRMSLVVLATAMGVFPSVLALLLASVAVGSLDINDTNFLKNYDRQRTVLENSLLIVGAVIGLGTLATGALQNALSAWKGLGGVSAKDAFPPIITVVYGGYFTLILTILYVPVRKSLISLADEYLEKSVALPEIDAADWVDKYDKRQKIRKSLGVETGSFESLKIASIVGTPLLSGIVTYALGK